MRRITTWSPEETAKLGERLGLLLRPGAVVCLLGDLGVGKTRFAQGIARGLGVTGAVTSPTFTIINEYQGHHPVYHMDFYRLSDPLELEDLGYEEYFFGSGITLIEWPERAGDLLPQERLDVAIDLSSEDVDMENTREISFSPRGAEFTALVENLIDLG